jgi:sterol desaturase/sphingolipid hydroxylase (fatty acid hydroxylase superfamily)
MTTHKAIAMLWDKASMLGTALALVWLVTHLDLYLSAEVIEPAVILFLPALLGNMLSIPLFWRRGSRRKKIGLLVPSVIVGLVGWLLFVPFASWLVAPLLSLRESFDPARELPLLLLYLALGELWFYGIHRFLHSRRRLFLLFHAHHHRVTDPHVVNASYQHPIELIVITMGTAWIGPLLVSGHSATVMIFHALIMILGNYGHSGEESIHDAHHRSYRGDNYGFLFLDSILGTAKEALRAAG